jgi:hypothetical protein|tara:strand:+ start:433 stop:789 length:357 start_codon:yes stop_codon:yes gene_type:complete
MAKLELWTQVKLYLEANSKTWEGEKDNLQLLDKGDGKTFINRWDVSGLAKPTDDQLKALESQAQTIDDNTLAIKNRKKEYPALGDIIDALFKKEAGDSSEWDALATKRATTKNKYKKS